MRDLSPPYDLAAAQRELGRADPLMRRLIRSVGPCGLRLRAGNDLFGALAHAIVHQQLSGYVAARIYARLLVCCGPRVRARPATLLACDDPTLLGAGLSRAKLRALRGVAEQIVDGSLPSRSRLQKLDDEALIARRSEVPGVGPWTAQMLLMHWLGRPDVLPSADLGVRKGMARLLNVEQIPGASSVREYGERWRPWRSVASWYLWRAAEDTRPAARPARRDADGSP